MAFWQNCWKKKKLDIHLKKLQSREIHKIITLKRQRFLSYYINNW
jgi:hypothetical protein